MDARRVCVRGIVNKNGKIFAQKLKNSEGIVKDYWCTPGGGIDPMESLHDALKREMIEETGVSPEIGRLMLIQQFATRETTSHGEAEKLEFFFEITNPDDYQSIDLTSTTHGDLEIAECSFIDPSAENLLPKVLQTPEFAAALNDPQAALIFYNELS